MSKILGSWSGMRKYLEHEMLAECLQGRIRYVCTTYVGMDDFKVFEFYLESNGVKRFSWETVNTYFINNGLKRDGNSVGETEYWNGFHKLLAHTPLTERTEYTDGEFCDALNEYRNQDVQTSIHSDNPLVRMFAVLDRRIGKRTLNSIKASLDEQPQWLKIFYLLRLEAQGV